MKIYEFDVEVWSDFSEGHFICVLLCRDLASPIDCKLQFFSLLKSSLESLEALVLDSATSVFPVFVG